MNEKIIFEDWFKEIRNYQERLVKVTITEDNIFIKLYENGILKLKKIKE